MKYPDVYYAACRRTIRSLLLVAGLPLSFAFAAADAHEEISGAEAEGAAVISNALASMDAVLVEREALRAALRADIRALIEEGGDLSPREVDELLRWHRAANMASYAELDLLHFEASHHQEQVRSLIRGVREAHEDAKDSLSGESLLMPADMIAAGFSRDEVRARIVTILAQEATSVQSDEVVDPNSEPRP